MGELYAPIPDRFELERPMRPKKAVGDYVESQGFLVPRRFEDLEEAQHAAEQGVNVLARSEHPDEYSGPSGLGRSGQLKRNQNGDFVPSYTLGRRRRPLHSKLWDYATMAGIDPNEYVNEASESFWEKIPGTNITVVADDAAEGRYHVLAYSIEDGRFLTETAAIVTEDGKIERQLIDVDEVVVVTRYKEIIDTYNAVRRLAYFSDVHCPIMEMQLSEVDNQVYFLQYHRSRDEAFVSERLNHSEFSEDEGWIRADLTRGARLGGGALALAIEYRGRRHGDIRANNIDLPEDGSTTVDAEYWKLDEHLSRQRIAHVLPTTVSGRYEKMATNHGPRTQMFKPQVSIVLDSGKRMPDGLFYEARRELHFNNRTVRIETEVLSDGRDAFVRYGDQLTLS